MDNVVKFEKKKKEYKVLATIDILKYKNKKFGYKINGKIKNFDILSEALIYVSNHILEEMLIYNNDPEYVLELMEEMGTRVLEEIYSDLEEE